MGPDTAAAGGHNSWVVAGNLGGQNWVGAGGYGGNRWVRVRKDNSFYTIYSKKYRHLIEHYL